MASEGRVPVLKKSRWLLLKREQNLKTEQLFRLRDLLRYNLKTVRAYLLKEACCVTVDLFISQRHNRIYSGRFACRNVTCNERHRHQKYGHQGKRHRIIRLDSVKQT